MMARLRLSRCVVKHTFVWLADAHVLLLLHMYTYEQNVSVTKVSKVISFALTPRWRILSLALSYPTEVHCARRTHQFLLHPRVCVDNFSIAMMHTGKCNSRLEYIRSPQPLSSLLRLRGLVKSHVMSSRSAEESIRQGGTPASSDSPSFRYRTPGLSVEQRFVASWLSAASPCVRSGRCLDS